MATGENDAQIVESGTQGANDDLLVAVQEAIHSSQEEFRAEINSLKASISNMNRHPHSIPNASTMSHEPSLPANLAEKIKLEKWKIYFDGTGNVSNFLFKINTLAKRTRCSDEQWYWDFIKQNADPTYSFLKFSISREFGTLESDDEILINIHKRKQQQKESYDSFHSTIVAMNSRMRDPLVEAKLIGILKRNVHSNLRIMLFNTDPRSLHSLRDLARDAEKVINENRTSFLENKHSRHVNEIETNSVVENLSDCESDPQIEALQFSGRTSKPDYSKIKCWNCLSLGHSYIYCPEETRTVFGYKCGERGVVTPKCKNIHQGTKKRSEMATGDSRSTTFPPSSQHIM